MKQRSVNFCRLRFPIASVFVALVKMTNKKAKQVVNGGSDVEDDQNSGSEDSDFDSDGFYAGEKEIQADFEGRNPEDCDFHGIKQLLRQLFLKSDVDLGELANLIISQNYIGSVVKQCLDDGMDEDDDDDDGDDGSDGVFGITTIINITKRKNESCIKQLRSLLLKLTEENGDDKTKKQFKDILEDDSNHVGLIINERILNIPAMISTPLFASLEAELKKANDKKMPYNFKYLIWISKTYKIGDEDEDTYANSEEEAIAKEVLASLDVDVSNQVDLSQWREEDVVKTPKRKIQLFEGSKLSTLIRLMKEETEGGLVA